MGEMSDSEKSGCYDRGFSNESPLRYSQDFNDQSLNTVEYSKEEVSVTTEQRIPVIDSSRIPTSYRTVESHDDRAPSPSYSSPRFGPNNYEYATRNIRNSKRHLNDRNTQIFTPPMSTVNNSEIQNKTRCAIQWSPQFKPRLINYQPSNPIPQIESPAAESSSFTPDAASSNLFSIPSQNKNQSQIFLPQLLGFQPYGFMQQQILGASPPVSPEQSEPMFINYTTPTNQAYINDQTNSLINTGVIDQAPTPNEVVIHVPIFRVRKRIVIKRQRQGCCGYLNLCHLCTKPKGILSGINLFGCMDREVTTKYYPDQRIKTKVHPVQFPCVTSS